MWRPIYMILFIFTYISLNILCIIHFRYTFSLHIFVYTLLFLIDSKRAEMANMPKLHYAKMTILPIWAFQASLAPTRSLTSRCRFFSWFFNLTFMTVLIRKTTDEGKGKKPGTLWDTNPRHLDPKACTLLLCYNCCLIHDCLLKAQQWFRLLKWVWEIMIKSSHQAVCIMKMSIDQDCLLQAGKQCTMTQNICFFKFLWMETANKDLIFIMLAKRRWHKRGEF